MNTNVSKKLKLVRLNKGISQEEIAAHLNILQSTYAKIERGDTRLSTSRLLEIADYLKVSPGELLPAEEDKYVFNNSTITKSFVENYYEGIKESFESQINSLKEEIAFLRKVIEREKL